MILIILAILNVSWEEKRSCQAGNEFMTVICWKQEQNKQESIKTKSKIILTAFDMGHTLTVVAASVWKD